MDAMAAQPNVSSTAHKYLALHLAGHVGPIRLKKLLDHFGTIDDILDASRSDLQCVEGVGPSTSKEIHASLRSDRVDREAERAIACGVSIVCPEDPAYPSPLRNVADPPICLYLRGHWNRADTLAVSIVGTRRCSHYGREQALRFAQLLSRAGFTIVSGLARGIDGHAHEGALRAGGRTLAVLGNGLPSIYPEEHEPLAMRIAGQGAIISEFPMDAAPEAHNFPRRNRLVAGLCLGTVVIEAGLRSGAMITARMATDYNREVFAVPGRVDSPELTAGTNGLIRDGGAKLVTCLDDLLDELGDVGALLRSEEPADTADSANDPLAKTRLPLAADELAVFDALGHTEADAETISEAADLPIGRTTAVLTSLQLKSLVRRLPGNRFAQRRRPAFSSPRPSSPPSAR